MTVALSIVIPTHKRPKILKETLERITKQTAINELEVIVVHDGTGDKETEHVVRSSWPMHVTYSEVHKSHQGVARNAGVKLAQGKVVLFIGDDIFLESDTCEKHLALRNSPFAILGHITWDHALQITSTMKWLESSGWQFGYPKIESYSGSFIPKDRQHFFTYTSNISLPRELALKYPFREDVSLYGWEDVEWGKRLADAGVPLFYKPQAKALHHHMMTLEDSLQRMETIGKSAVMIEQLNSSLHVVPRGIKRFLYELIALMPTMRGQHTKAFLKGLQS
jgi:glycosyltransferase involved in cell wall biosynthesis